MRKAAILVVLALTAVGCAEDPVDRPPEAGPGGSPSPTSARLTLTLVATSEGPVARLSGGSGEVEGAAYTSCWGQPEAALCVDGFPTTPEAFVDAPSGATLRVQGDAESVEAGVARVRPDDVGAELQVVQDLPIEDGRAVIDVDPGEYVLQVFAQFEQGDGAFALGLRVLPR